MAQVQRLLRFLRPYTFLFLLAVQGLTAFALITLGVLLKKFNVANHVVGPRIRQEIAANPVVLYMKGSPVFPQCGFSAAVVQILSQLGVKFKGIDVLADPAIRQGVKDFSNWPTIPQLYVKGEFVGGCDLVHEMYETGEVQQMFEEKGIPTRA